MRTNSVQTRELTRGSLPGGGTISSYRVQGHKTATKFCFLQEVRHKEREPETEAALTTDGLREATLKLFFSFLRITDRSVRKPCRRAAQQICRRDGSTLTSENTSQQNNLCTTSVRLLLWRFQSYYLFPRDTIESRRSAAQRWDCLANRCFPRSTVVKEEPTNTTGKNNNNSRKALQKSKVQRDTSKIIQIVATNDTRNVFGTQFDAASPCKKMFLLQ